MNFSDVVVIGAGPSGSYAAKLLSDRGHSVSLLEAKDRVGGRTWVDAVPGGTIDLGGQWIGETHNHLKELGRELGLQTMPSGKPGNDLFVFDDNTIVGDEDQVPASAEFADELTASLEALDAVGASLGTEPWSSPEVHELDRITVAQWLDKNVKHPYVRAFHNTFVNILNGADPAEVSMAYWAYFAHQGEGINSLIATKTGAQSEWFIGGMGTVSEKIAERLGAALHLDCPVTRIVQDDSGVTACSGDKRFHAKYVILATPPSAGGRIAFDPPLPNRRSQLQLRAPMGRLTKIQVRYQEPFWREHAYSGAILECGDISFWIFDGSKPTDTLSTIVGFAGGSDFDRWAAYSPSEREEKFLSTLEKHFGESARKYEYYHETSWPEQPWTWGAPVTYMPPGLLSSTGSALREPIGRIHFAGTEASPMWSGYIEGGLRAGRIAADEVSRRLAGES